MQSTGWLVISAAGMILAGTPEISMISFRRMAVLKLSVSVTGIMKEPGPPTTHCW
jgi:hypothetical protein